MSNPEYKVTELTKDQIDKFPEYVKKWVDIGLNTDECDVENASAQVPL